MTTTDRVQREVWATRRASLEKRQAKHQFHHRYGRRHWRLFMRLLDVVEWGLRVTGLESLGRRNARALELVHHELKLEGLPPAFDGYRLIHLTDLHLDRLPGLEEDIVKVVKEVEPVDLIAITGDFRDAIEGKFDHILPPMKVLADNLKAGDGIVFTLGNHDCAAMVPPLEKLGMRALANETVTLNRKGDSIRITGIDDVHYYYTDSARHELERTGEGFKIVLVHSPEIYDLTEENGYSLSLSGHTHGGQICLPGGVPIITHIDAPRKYARGLWKHGRMTGYTSKGAGVVRLPVRFNCRGEVTLFTLRCG